MKEYCQFCHFSANFSDFEMIKTTREITDYDTKEKRTIEFFQKNYIGQAVYIDKNGKFVCLPCAVAGRYDLEKRKTYTPKSEIH